MAAGTLVELTAAQDDIDTTDQLVMFEYYQKVIVVNGTNLKIADFVNTELTVTALTTAPTRGSIVTQATSGATMVVDFVNTAKTKIYGKTTAGTFTTTAGHTLSGGGMDPETRVPSTVNEATTTPLWYDLNVYPDAGSGSLPDTAYLGCNWRGRLVLSGNPDYPQQWYMSRQADHTDFQYIASDAQAPVAGGNADAGEIGDIVTALIPYTDDYLIFGCSTSIHILRGDPAAGGSRDMVDGTTGIFGHNSWCFDSERNLYFWGANGLYRMQAGGSFNVENISDISLPELTGDEGADPSTHRITMEYDRKNMGIVVCVTLMADGTNSNYFISLKETTTGIFPESYPTACGAYSLIFYDANDKDYQDLLVGCTDGYIRKFDPTAKDDDVGGSDTAISSYVLYPIQPMAEFEDYEGKLTSLTLYLAGGAASGAESDADGVSWELHTSNDAETLIEDVKDGATAFATGTLSATGRATRVRPRMRGAFMGIKLYNSTASETWAMNKILGDIIPAGRLR